MKYLILADIHGNFPALKKVLTHAKGKYDRMIVLGDLVGYLAQPNECVHLLRENGADQVFILGNHDAACVDLLDYANFTPEAKFAVDWTKEVLTADNRDFLASLPETIVMDGMHLVHGTKTAPVTEYMIHESIIRRNFEMIRPGELIACGHHHVAHLMRSISERDFMADLVIKNKDYKLTTDAKFIIKTFSVGFPRDGHNQAGYCLFDSERRLLSYCRVGYPVAQTIKAIQKAGLPDKMVYRIRNGV